MNLKKIAMGAFALSCAVSAQADVTIDITGATAFRVATLDAIKATYVASGQPFKYAHDRSAGGSNGATLSIWQGKFGSVPGVTTIRTSFNGSVEGVRAITQGPAHNPNYLNNPAAFVSATSVVGGTEIASTTTPVIAAESEFAFSDVSIAATPYAGFPVAPADAKVGVVVFTMIANEGAPAGLSNITNKQFQALFSSGYMPLSVFSGDPADSGSYVFATGRNDGSGTRTTYMAETGLGITTGVQQYTRGAISGNTITQIHRVPAGGFSASIPGSAAANASTVWGKDIAGNGGYSSGSALRDDMGRTSAATQVLDADGSVLLAAGDAPIHLVTWLSLGDAVPAKTAGAKILGYNGVTLDSIAAGASVMNATDKAKVTQGAYTAWSYQQLYRRASLTGDAVTAYNVLKAAIPANLGATGIPIADMAVSRAVDGGPVAP